MHPQPRSSANVLLVTVGLVTAAALAGCGASDGDVASPAPVRTWNQTHRVEPPAGWTVTQRNVDRADESTSLSGPKGKGCLVRTWSSEPEAHARPSSAEQVVVQGNQGSYGPLDPDYGPYPRTVIWQDPSKRWAGVSCDLDKTGILALAESVTFGPHPMHVPFRLSAIPEGLTLVALIESHDPAADSAAVLFETPGPARGLTMQIYSVPDFSSLGRGAPVEHRTIAGRRAEIRTSSQTICFPTRSEPICIFGPGDEPVSDWSPAARELALRTAALLSPVENPADTASWLDADEALPR